MNQEERQVRIVQLKDDIARVAGAISSLEADKKETAKGFNNTIKEMKTELEVHLSELNELKIQDSRK